MSCILLLATWLLLLVMLLMLLLFVIIVNLLLLLLWLRCFFTVWFIEMQPQTWLKKKPWNILNTHIHTPHRIFSCMHLTWAWLPMVASNGNISIPWRPSDVWRCYIHSRPLYVLYLTLKHFQLIHTMLHNPCCLSFSFVSFDSFIYIIYVYLIASSMWFNR